MKKDNKNKDIVFTSILIIFLLLIMSKPYSNLVSDHAYLDGFIKFSVLATMGELLSDRISKRSWTKTNGLIWKIGIWGIFGSLVCLMFSVFSEGVIGAQKNGMLAANNRYLTAFLTSAIMNTTSGPVMMALQRVCNTYIDLKYKQDKITFGEVVEVIDWVSFVKFEVSTTTPLIWIPANTLTFLMPERYRILAAALLSMILGLILSIGKKLMPQNSSSK